MPEPNFSICPDEDSFVAAFRTSARELLHNYAHSVGELYDMVDEAERDFIQWFPGNDCNDVYDEYDEADAKRDRRDGA